MKLLIGLATAAVVIATGAQADPSVTYEITRQGRQVTIDRIDTNTGKVTPPPTRTYIQDSKGNLRDPVTGWPKGRNY